MINNLEGTADKFVGGDLYGLVPVSLYSSPGGKYLRQISKGQYIGTIYSFKTNNSDLWWQLDDKEGNHLGYVKHEEKKFDENKLMASLIIAEQKRQKEIDDAINKRPPPDLDLNLGDLFNNLLTPIIILIVLLIILQFSKK